MKVGDYVRTNRGTFDRFITTHTQDNFTWYTFEDRGNITNPENYVVKSSQNIIDLIEVGDIITFKKDDDVYKVLCVPNKECACDDFYLVYNGLEFEDIRVTKKDMQKDIKSIVTKEQFESMEYEVK